MPDRGSIEGSKPSAKPAWGPIEDWHSDDIRQAPKSAEQEAALGVKLLVVNEGWNGAGRGCGW